MLEVRRVDGVPIWRVAVASSWLARLRGLMGRSSVPEGEGLFLPGTNSIHMMFMRFPIDCVFLSAERADGARQVVGVRARVAPWTGVVWWVRGADGVLEVPAGSAARADVKAGDSLRIG